MVRFLMKTLIINYIDKLNEKSSLKVGNVWKKTQLIMTAGYVKKTEENKGRTQNIKGDLKKSRRKHKGCMGKRMTSKGKAKEKQRRSM